VSSVAHHDSRSLFEQAWSLGIRTGVLTPRRREELLVEGTRAIRKIADLFGTEYLRGDLERAMRSMLGLLNIHLERVSGGDVEKAAMSIAENGLLFHTRGASRAIKRVLAVSHRQNPDTLEPEDLRRYETIVVTEWPTRSLAYLLEREQGAREDLALREAAQALVSALDGPSDLSESEPGPVIMTALLALACQTQPSWPRHLRGFEALLAAVRRSPAKLDRMPQGVPAAHREVVGSVWAANAGVIKALVADTSVPLHVLAGGGPDVNPLYGRLEVPDDTLGEVDGHSIATTAHWQALTRGATDEARLLLVLLQGLAGVTSKPPFSLKSIAGLLKAQLQCKPDDRLFEDWLTANVPYAQHPDLTELWEAFWEERDALLSEDPASDEFKQFARAWFPMRAAPARPGAARALGPETTAS